MNSAIATVEPAKPFCNMRDRALVLICLTLSMAWVTIAAIYLYPDVKEEFEQHRYLRRIGKLHTPVIPIECPRARGIENQDFIREDKNPNRCWVDLASFRRNYPENRGGHGCCRHGSGQSP